MTTKIWKALVSLALVVLLLVVAAEFGVRWMISDQMKKDFAATGQASEEPKISFGPTPVLLSQITGTIPHVVLDTPSTVSIADGPNGAPRVAGAPATKVDIKDLNIKDQNNPVAGHLDVNTELPEDFLLAQAQASMAGNKVKSGDLATNLIQGLVKITKVDTVAADQSLKVEFTDGAATLTLRPKVENGTLKFAAEDASLLGMNLPGEVSDVLTKSLERQSTELSGLLKVQAMDVQDDKILLHLAGDNVPLNDLQGTGEPQRPTSGRG